MNLLELGCKYLPFKLAIGAHCICSLFIRRTQSGARWFFHDECVCIAKQKKIAASSSSTIRRIRVVMSPAALCYAWTALLGACMRGIKWDLGVAGINKYISICALSHIQHEKCKTRRGAWRIKQSVLLYAAAAFYVVCLHNLQKIMGEVIKFVFMHNKPAPVACSERQSGPRLERLDARTLLNYCTGVTSSGA